MEIMGESVRSKAIKWQEENMNLDAVESCRILNTKYMTEAR